ncbi:MAG: hypothetical protein F4X44_10435 [Gammaproteobacteria bacterium]|nr:hypothetical protein [Gammaproteobacteria bacterium]MYD81015.1 hypothetical protein [Gammaproteobacteria bacterium]
MGAYILASNDWILWATIGIAFVYIAWALKRLFDPTDTEELPKHLMGGYLLCRVTPARENGCNKRWCGYRLRSVLDAVSKAKPLSP